MKQFSDDSSTSWAPVESRGCVATHSIDSIRSFVLVNCFPFLSFVENLATDVLNTKGIRELLM